MNSHADVEEDQGGKEDFYETSKMNKVEVEIHLDRVPVRVDIVNIEGLRRTKDDYMRKHLKDILKVSTFQELVLVTGEVQNKLQKLGCFKKVGVLIDTNKNEDASTNGYEVTIFVNETGRFVGNVNTMVGSNDGSISFNCQMPNVLGRGEKVNLEHKLCYSDNQNTKLSFAKPVQRYINSEISTTLFLNKTPNPFSSYVSQNCGALIDFSFQHTKNLYRNIQWEGVWRQLASVSQSIPLAISKQCGHSFKSAIKHLVTLDRRDERVFPTSGILLKIVHELAGLGGDATFIKQDSRLEVNYKLPYNLVFQSTFCMGFIYPFGQREHTHNIADLFFLGGPQSLRGFEMNSLGSRIGNSYLGGKSYWSTAVHLYTPLPFPVGRSSIGDSFRTHFFFNAGNISGREDTEPSKDGLHPYSWQPFLNNIMDFKAAYGVGFAANIMQSAKLELNYCWPIKFNSEDKAVHGFQLGIGLEFL